MNGFKVVPNSDGDESDNSFLIKSLPMSKKTIFTVDDFYELIEIVNENVDQDERNKNSEFNKDKMLHKEILRPKKIY